MFSLFKIPKIYLQLSAERVEIRDPAMSIQYVDSPEIAIQQRDGKSVVPAVGSQARLAAAQNADTQVHNPLQHPRTLIADFVLAEQMLKYHLRACYPRKLLTPSPHMLIHPHQPSEGGLTQVELRALHDLAMASGASKVRIWQGPVLSDEQVRSSNYPADGQILLG